MTWATEPKKFLTPNEVLAVAHAHLVCGVAQSALAAMYGINQGRINEAIVVMRETAEHHMYTHAQLRPKKEKNG